jgi:transcriptional regulator with XRE-family HTH domain
METYDYGEFRRKIRDERKRRGWTQSDLAARLAEHGVTGWRAATVAKLENGDRGVQLGEAVALADILGGVSLDLLAGRHGQPVGDLVHARRSLLATVNTATQTLIEMSSALESRGREVAAADPEQKCLDLLGEVYKLQVAVGNVTDTALRIGREYGNGDA